MNMLRKYKNNYVFLRGEKILRSMGWFLCPQEETFVECNCVIHRHLTQEENQR